jgi:hypothetical protein
MQILNKIIIIDHDIVPFHNSQEYASRILRAYDNIRHHIITSYIIFVRDVVVLIHKSRWHLSQLAFDCYARRKELIKYTRIQFNYFCFISLLVFTLTFSGAARLPLQSFLYRATVQFAARALKVTER